MAVPDTPARLRLRVTLKLLALAGVVALAAIALMFAFGGPAGERDAPRERIDVADWAAGEARLVTWSQRPVIVIRPAAAPGEPAVWFAIDPRHGCLLRWAHEPGELRSRCADARYGVDGRPLGATRGPALRAPTHRVGRDGVVVLGVE
jgi:hypothetical protein